MRVLPSPSLEVVVVGTTGLILELNRHAKRVSQPARLSRLGTRRPISAAVMSRHQSNSAAGVPTARCQKNRTFASVLPDSPCTQRLAKPRTSSNASSVPP